MSNIKYIQISGKLPFNCYENKELQPFLAQFCAPSIRLELFWGNGEFIPNNEGGQTMMYDFTIMGEEAVSHGWLERLKDAILSCWGGRIDKMYVKDIENNIVLEQYRIP